MVELLGRNVSITPLNVGFVIGVLSVITIFCVESSLTRNFLGLLIGSGFSPAFTSESSHSNRYFALEIALISFTIMVLAGFRWPLIIALFIVSISATVEADTRSTMEAVRREEKQES